MPSAIVEHVGSTSVPELVAKPILDIDVIVDDQHMARATAVLVGVGYLPLGDLGVVDREAFLAPDDNPARNVYVCRRGSLNLRNHLAVRDVLRSRPDLRDEYGAVKLALASDPLMDIDTYVRRKSMVLQKVLGESDLTADECLRILELNDPPSPHTSQQRGRSRRP